MLTLAETAEKLRVSVRTVEREIRDGRLACVLEDGKRCVSEDEVAAYLERCREVRAEPMDREARRRINPRRAPLPHKRLDALLSAHASNKAKFPYSGPAVYFLWQGDDLVYVGQTVNLLYRIATHFGEKLITFDHFSYIECAEEDLLNLERRAIFKFDPPMNY